MKSIFHIQKGVYHKAQKTFLANTSWCICIVDFIGFYFFPTDGSDLVQQWSKFNLGALHSGPDVDDECKTQSQPSGQAAVSFDIFLFFHWILFFLLSYSLLFSFFWMSKPKQNGIHKSQISNAGICASNALPGGWQLHNQGLKQGEEGLKCWSNSTKLKYALKKSLSAFSLRCSFFLIYSLATSLKCSHRKSWDLFKIVIPRSTSKLFSPSKTFLVLKPTFLFFKHLFCLF